MNAIGKTGGLLLGAALIAGCNERNAQTGPTAIRTGPFSADVAAGKTSVVLDGTGDWVDKTGQDYQDIVRSEITKSGHFTAKRSPCCFRSIGPSHSVS